MNDSSLGRPWIGIAVTVMILLAIPSSVARAAHRASSRLSQEIQVDADAWPNPYQSTDQITISVDASWDPSGDCEDEEWCEPGSVEVDIYGSDGFEESDYGSAGDGFGDWDFTDPDAASYGGTVTYDIYVTASFWDEITEEEVDSYGEGSAWVSPAAPNISGSSVVWWFNGENPGGGYETTVTLTSDAGDATTWQVVNGSDKVYLSTSQGGSVDVSSTGTVSSSSGDITVRASLGSASTDFQMTALRPYKLVPGDPFEQCNAQYGYDTYIPYTIVDQLGDSMPYSVPVNEQWLSGVYTDYYGTNWRQYPVQPGSSNGAAFDDHIGGELFSLPAYPTPTCDGNSTPVVEWDQGWHIGSQGTGAGVFVQTDTLTKLIGIAIHNGVVSPPF